MKNIYTTIILALFGLSLMGQGAAPVDTDNNGKLEIDSKDNLLYLSQNSSADLAADYEQTVDLTFTSTDFSNGGAFYNSGSFFQPIGFDDDNSGATFSGTYDGQNHTITGLKINRPSTSTDKNPNVGLFSHIDQDVTIKNLGLKDVTISGGRGTGALVGRVTGNVNTLIQYCYADGGTVVGDGATGGLVGSNNSHRATENAGNDRPVISNCFANIDVSWSQNYSNYDNYDDDNDWSDNDNYGDKFGGLVGCNQKGITEYSYALGDVTVINNETSSAPDPANDKNYERVGGLAGCTYLKGEISYSYSRGQVTTDDVNLVGGLVGKVIKVGSGSSDDGSVTESYYDEKNGNPDIKDGSTETSVTNVTSVSTSDMDDGNWWNDNTTWDDESEWNINSSTSPTLYQSDGSTPLPVELMELHASRQNRMITVHWATASETNNDFFEVQVSEDGYSYSTAGTVAGAGNNNEVKNYEYEYSESNPVRYVRLRQVDYNGAMELHGPVYIKQNDDAEDFQPEVYPNPVESDFYVSFPEPLEGETHVRLYNSMGQRVKNITLQPGEQNLHIQISNDMPAGIYFLTIDGTVHRTEKINIR